MDPEFDALLVQHMPAVYAFGWRLSGNRQDAEDVAQQTFFQAFRARKRFEGRSGVRTWLFRIAIRVAARVLRERERNPHALLEHESAERDPLEALERDEELRAVRRALVEIAPIDRLVLTLFTIDGMTHREIGELLECPEGTVWSRLHHAKAALQKRLAAQDSEWKR